MKVINFLILFAVGTFSFAQNIKYAEPKKLPIEVNSTSEEIMPIYNNNKLYYSRLGEKSLNIWMSENKNGQWRKSTNSFSVNNKDHNVIIGMSSDGKRGYLLNEYGKEGMELGLSVSKISENSWSKPEPVKIESLVLTENSAYGFYVNPSETVILISMYGKDSKGKEDLYVSLKKGNVWQKPINLGGTINSKGFEISPFISEDRKTLYFSSDGRGGEGNADIYKATRLDDSWSKWSTPENMGKPINGPAFDAYFTLVDKIGYFSSDRNDSHSSIYKVEELKPEIIEDKIDSSIIVQGNVYEEDTKDPIEVEIDVTDESNSNFHKKVTTSADGSYSLNLEKGKKYIFNVLVPKYHEHHDAFFVNMEETKSKFKLDLPMKKLKVGDDIKLDYLYFVVSTDSLRAVSIPEVDKLVKIMLENPELKLSIEGHTDNSGTQSSNEKLSLARAEAIRDILLESGVKKKRLKTIGWGQKHPLVKNLTPESRKKNRRVEFKIK